MPGDRAFAVLNDAAPDIDDWQPRRNFLQVASGPALAAVRVTTHGNRRMSFSHPDAAPTRPLYLPQDGAALIDWARRFWPDDRPGPARVVAAPAATGMPDNGVASLSIIALPTLREIAARLGRGDLDAGRFRGNIVIDGGTPWAEFDWVGRGIVLGGVRLHVTGRIERCRATEADPATGERDADVLSALRDGWGHRDCGVYATVTAAGTVSAGDTVETP